MCYVACVETLKCETVLNGKSYFLLKLFFHTQQCHGKTSKTRKSEYIIYKWSTKIDDVNQIRVKPRNRKQERQRKLGFECG